MLGELSLARPGEGVGEGWLDGAHEGGRAECAWGEDDVELASKEFVGSVPELEEGALGKGAILEVALAGGGVTPGAGALGDMPREGADGCGEDPSCAEDGALVVEALAGEDTLESGEEAVVELEACLRGEVAEEGERGEREGVGDLVFGDIDAGAVLSAREGFSVARPVGPEEGVDLSGGELVVGGEARILVTALNEVCLHGIKGDVAEHVDEFIRKDGLAVVAVAPNLSILECGAALSGASDGGVDVAHEEGDADFPPLEEQMKVIAEEGEGKELDFVALSGAGKDGAEGGVELGVWAKPEAATDGADADVVNPARGEDAWSTRHGGDLLGR